MRVKKYISDKHIAIADQIRLASDLRSVIEPSNRMPGFYSGDTFDVFHAISKHMVDDPRGVITERGSIYFYIIIRDARKGDFLIMHRKKNEFMYIGGPIFPPIGGYLCSKFIRDWDEFDLFNQAYESAVAGLSATLNVPYHEPIQSYSPTWGLDDFREWIGWRSIGLDSHRTPEVFIPFNLSAPCDSIYIPNCDVDDLADARFRSSLRLFKIVNVPLLENLYDNAHDKNAPIQVLNDITVHRINWIDTPVSPDADYYRYLGRVGNFDADVVRYLLRV